MLAVLDLVRIPKGEQFECKKIHIFYENLIGKVWERDYYVVADSAKVLSCRAYNIKLLGVELAQGESVF